MPFILFLFLKIRLLQGYRLLQELGWLRVLLFAVFVIPFAIRYIVNPHYTLFAYGVLLSSIHFFRTDTHFLRLQHFPYRAIFRCEYGILAAPMLVYLAWQQNWLYVGLLLLLVAVLPYLSLTIRVQPFQVKWLSKIFHPQAFELQSGVRKNLPVLVVAWLAAAFSMQFIYALPVFIIFLTLHTAFYYLEMEAAQIPSVVAKNPMQLLGRKIQFQYCYFWLFLSPLLILFCIFHTNYWFIIAYFVFSSSLAQLFPIFYKYAVFSPAQQPIYNGWIYAIFCTILLFIVLIPFFIPVGLFALWRYFHKSQQQMAVYF